MKLDRVSPAGPGEENQRHTAAQALEGQLLRQILKASGAFKPSEVAGGGIRADMFVETLADALANAGGFGLADMIEKSLPPVPGAPAPQPKETPAPESPPVAVHDAPEAPRITGNFGPRHDPIDGGTRYHTGVDVAAPTGQPILAIASGTVKRAGVRGGYGNAIELQHADGTTTLYGHASRLLVHEGDQVADGQAIALVGATGRATGPHLHFEVRVDDRPQNPQLALKVYGKRVEDTIAGRPRSLKTGGSP